MPTINRKYLVFLGLGIIIVAGTLAWLAYRQHQEDKEELLIETRAIKTRDGWGYQIDVGGKSFIRQEYIPAITGRHSFRTKDDALKVGRHVIAKMSGRSLPTVSVDELRALGVLPDSLLH
jgi:hypothetical protein